MVTDTPPIATPAQSFNLAPLWFEAFACTMSLMGFLAIIAPIARLLGLAPWHVGLAITSAGAAWTLLARLWGHAGDIHGRRRIMLAGLGGFVVSYAILCLFIEIALRLSFPVLVAFIGIALARTLAGGFYAAIPASSVALIGEHFPAAQRAAAIGAISGANGLGMAVGPAIAGLLASFAMGWSLLFIAVLPALSFAVLWMTLPRDRPTSVQRQARLPLLDKRLRQPLSVALLAMMSVAIAQVSVGFYALDRLGLAPTAAARSAGIAFAAVGVALMGAQMLLRRLAWPETQLIRVGSVVSALGFGFAAFAASEVALWLAYFIGAAGMGIVFPAFFALAANAVGSHEQGGAAGAVSSAQGLGAIVGPIVGASIYALDIRAPYALIAVLLVVTALMVREAKVQG